MKPVNGHQVPRSTADIGQIVPNDLILNDL